MIANSLKWHKEHGAEPPETSQSRKQLQNYNHVKSEKLRERLRVWDLGLRKE